jgi:hypothetical protein
MNNGRIPAFAAEDLTNAVAKRLDKASAMLSDLRSAGPRRITDEAVIRNYACLIKTLVDEARQLQTELWRRTQPKLIETQLGQRPNGRSPSQRS